MNPAGHQPAVTRSAAVSSEPFVLDANAWIRAWDRYYPSGVFQKVWNDLERAVAQGQIIIPEQIGDELVLKATGLDEWMKKLKPLWIPHDHAVETQMAAIIASYKDLVYKGKRTPRSTGDAALIATAIIQEASIITHEKYKTGPNRPSVSWVSDRYRVPWDSNLAVVFMHLGWKYP